VREREESEKREREKRTRKKAARRFKFPDTWHKVAEPPVAPEQRTRLYHTAHIGAI
jgi:hypothetical protein